DPPTAANPKFPLFDDYWKKIRFKYVRESRSYDWDGWNDNRFWLWNCIFWDGWGKRIVGDARLKNEGEKQQQIGLGRDSGGVFSGMV
ncbi:unnamed protein product, partial [Linum tenue]